MTAIKFNLKWEMWMEVFFKCGEARREIEWSGIKICQRSVENLGFDSFLSDICEVSLTWNPIQSLLSLKHWYYLRFNPTTVDFLRSSRPWGLKEYLPNWTKVSHSSGMIPLNPWRNCSHSEIAFNFTLYSLIKTPYRIPI